MLPTVEEVKKEFEAAIEAAYALAEDSSLDDNDPRFVEMLDRLNEISGAYYSLCEVTA
jgi:hypothetical protein